MIDIIQPYLYMHIKAYKHTAHNRLIEPYIRVCMIDWACFSFLSCCLFIGNFVQRHSIFAVLKSIASWQTSLKSNHLATKDKCKDSSFLGWGPKELPSSLVFHLLFKMKTGTSWQGEKGTSRQGLSTFFRSLVHVVRGKCTVECRANLLYPHSTLFPRKLTHIQYSIEIRERCIV